MKISKKKLLVKQTFLQKIMNNLAYDETYEKYLINSNLIDRDHDRRTQSYDRNRDRRSFLNGNQDRDRDRNFRKSHCASNNWPIWTQNVPKEA